MVYPVCLKFEASEVESVCFWGGGGDGDWEDEIVGPEYCVEGEGAVVFGVG